MLSGPCRFDGGIQGQQIGLEGDLIDHFDDLADVLPRLVNIVHGCDHGPHLSIAFFGGGFDFAGELIGLGGIFGILAGLRTHLGHRTGNLFQRTGRFGGALREGLAGICHLAAARGDLLGGRADLAHDIVQITAKFVERAPDDILFILGFCLNS